MLIGSNWVLGYSHTGPAADAMIRQRFSQREAVTALIEAYLAYDIDAMMAPFAGKDVLLDGIHAAEDRTGKKVTLIDTPILDLSDSAEGRANARKVIEEGSKLGSDFCLIHHSSVEKLVSKMHGTMDRLPDYLDMIRQAGMIPGLSAHMPELIVYSDQNGYDVETYIQLYNCMGFLMQDRECPQDHLERPQAGHDDQVHGSGARIALCGPDLLLCHAASLRYGHGRRAYAAGSA